MLRAIVEDVATLAQRRELVERAIARIMVEVCAGQYHGRPGTILQNILSRPPHAPSSTAAPALPFTVPPSSIPEMKHSLPVRAPAMLAAVPGSYETHMVRELRPIDRVQKHVLGTDRHQAADPAVVSAR